MYSHIIHYLRCKRWKIKPVRMIILLLLLSVLSFFKRLKNFMQFKLIQYFKFPLLCWTRFSFLRNCVIYFPQKSLFSFYAEAHRRRTSKDCYFQSEKFWCSTWQTRAIPNGFIKNQLLWGTTVLYDVKDNSNWQPVRDWSEAHQL